MDELKNQKCPVCKQDTLTLIEENYNIPHFGKCFLMSMDCSNCNFHKVDVESEERKEPCKYSFVIKSKSDLSVKVIKSSEATIKIPQLKLSVTPGPSSTGYITNVEGILSRFKKIIEDQRDLEEEPEIKKKAKNLLKKLWKVELGEIELKITLEDPSGNSAILSDKAEVQKL